MAVDSHKSSNLNTPTATDPKLPKRSQPQVHTNQAKTTMNKFQHPGTDSNYNNLKTTSNRKKEANHPLYSMYTDPTQMSLQVATFSNQVEY